MTLPVLRGEHADELTIVDPATGEVLDPHDATDEQLARWRLEVLDWESDARRAKALVDQVLLKRMDADATWTRHADGYKLTAPSPTPLIGYPDPEALYFALAKVVGLSPDAVARAVEPVVTYTPRAAGIKALRALNRPDVNAIIDEHSVKDDRPRRVTVKKTRR